MAKYTINHTCGHESEVNLVGAHRERDRKIEWLEGQQCWKCRKDAEFAAAQADTSPVIATIRPRLAIREGAVGVVVLFEGGCYNRRDELKSADAIYSEPGDMGGIFGLLGTSKPSKCWHITATLTAAQVVELVEGGKARTITAATIWRTIAAMVGVPADIEVRSADEAGDLRVLSDALTKAYEGAQDAADQDAAKAAWIAANPRPATVPMSEIVGIEYRRWNGRIYSGGRVYLDGNEIKLTDAQYDAYLAGQKNLEAWLAAAKAAGITL